MTNAMAQCANRDAVEAVRLAMRLHGAKLGWHLAAEALGVSDRTARALANGETSGATINPDRAHDARMTFRRQRAEQIRAELRELGEMDGAYLGHGEPRARLGGGQDVGRGELLRVHGPALACA